MLLLGEVMAFWLIFYYRDLTTLDFQGGVLIDGGYGCFGVY